MINQAWKSNQLKILSQAKQDSRVNACGDGRSDSPGHSAKYGTYTVINEETGKVIAFSVIQVSEVTSLNAMEFNGCKRTLNSLLEASPSDA